MRRDFTYVDDIVAGVMACLDSPPVDDGSQKAGGSLSPHALYNIGNHRSVELEQLIRILEKSLGRAAITEFYPLQSGDLVETFADISAIRRDHGFEPSTSVEEGLPLFVDWYKRYHRIS